jgi:hypothetical protein
MHIQPDRKSRRWRPSKPVQGYEIQVAGHLEEGAFDWFGEVVIANQENGSALLSGDIPDQAALLRMLLHLNDLGLTILSVKALRRRK